MDGIQFTDKQETPREWNLTKKFAKKLTENFIRSYSVLLSVKYLQGNDKSWFQLKLPVKKISFQDQILWSYDSI